MTSTRALSSCGTTASAACAGDSDGYRNLMSSTPATPPPSCAAMNTGAEDGAMPAKLSENIRPMVIAGLVKLVEEVNQYAAPIQAPTAAGAVPALPDRASAKITS